MACPYPVKPKNLRESIDEWLSRRFFVSEEVLEMPAELPQMPKRFFFACGTSANAQTFFFRFAELPQAIKRGFLICGSSASISKSAEEALHHGFDHLFDEGDLFLA